MLGLAVVTYSRHCSVLLLPILIMPTGMRSSKFKVTVSLLSGRSLQMVCCGAGLVEELKKRLAEQTGMDWFGQCLYYKDKELQDGETLAMAGITRNAEVMLVFDDSRPPPLVDSSDEEP